MYLPRLTQATSVLHKCINSSKGPSKNVNVFMSVPNIHFRGGCGKQCWFPRTFNVLAYFHYHAIFLALKKNDVYTFWRGSEKLYVFGHLWKCWYFWMAPNFSIFRPFLGYKEWHQTCGNDYLLNIHTLIK